MCGSAGYACCPALVLVAPGRSAGPEAAPAARQGKLATAKDADMSPFEAGRKLLSLERLSLGDRIELVFQDADLVPLLVQARGSGLGGQTRPPSHPASRPCSCRRAPHRARGRGGAARVRSCHQARSRASACSRALRLRAWALRGWACCAVPLLPSKCWMSAHACAAACTLPAAWCTASRCLVLRQYVAPSGALSAQLSPAPAARLRLRRPVQENYLNHRPQIAQNDLMRLKARLGLP